jgi:hypothetical protein
MDPLGILNRREREKATNDAETWQDPGSPALSPHDLRCAGEFAWGEVAGEEDPANASSPHMKTVNKIHAMMDVQIVSV